jgi:tetratricopeptide (TPR) repeat protein
VLIFLLLILVGVLVGYGTGISQRLNTKATVVTGQLQQQYQLGMQALKAGQYENAKNYFDFVIANDPSYPGIQQAYVQLGLLMNLALTPTMTPTPLFTSTPDTRSDDQKLSDIEKDLAVQDWNDALVSLDSLRKADPSYQTAVVDGLYYTALRMLGVSLISSADCQDHNLEGGIYDLTIASNFGSLDRDAASLQTYARLYIDGASFWDEDWVQAQYFFAEVAAAYPDMMDSSCQSANERWRIATISYAQQLQAAGNNCEAAKQYASAFTVSSPQNQQYYASATAVWEKCPSSHPAAPTSTPGTETATVPSTAPPTGAPPTNTPVPPTNTPVPPTNTPVPPTSVPNTPTP